MADSIEIIRREAERRVQVALGRNTRTFDKGTAIAIVLAAQSAMEAISHGQDRETQRDILIETFKLAGELQALAQQGQRE
jgi:hypothetical protein